jgi:hypothetical protein
MKLIDTFTLQLVSFSEPTPNYAILSHTWGPDNEEVSYQDMTATKRSDDTINKPGFHKIQKTCEIARKTYGLQYVWIDTCCIDKTSSAELSESINSMFRWYQEAIICLAFLADVDEIEKSLVASRWFTRGWTLQELIAPQDLVFLDMTWARLGSKNELLDRVSGITGIQSSVLNGKLGLDQVPVAVRMSWASMRQTTRTEDIAYCLMGLFGINMPMLYGEGTNAFLRLQEEIVKNNPDMSIFAWTRPPSRFAYNLHSGILASSPRDFQQMRDIKPIWTGVQVPEFSVTNRGLKFDLHLSWGATDGLCILPLGHGIRQEGHVGVHLRQIGSTDFVRANTSEVIPSPSEFFRATSGKEFRVAKVLTANQCIAMYNNTLYFERPGLIWTQSYSNTWYKPTNMDYKIEKVRPRGIWNPVERVLYAGPNSVAIFFVHLVPVAPNLEPGFVVSCCSLPNDKWLFELLPANYWPATDHHVPALYQQLLEKEGLPVQSLYIPPEPKSDLHRLVSLSVVQTEHENGVHTNLRLHIHQPQQKPTDT